MLKKSRRMITIFSLMISLSFLSLLYWEISRLEIGGLVIWEGNLSVQPKKRNRDETRHTDRQTENRTETEQTDRQNKRMDRWAHISTQKEREKTSQDPSGRSIQDQIPCVTCIPLRVIRALSKNPAREGEGEGREE